MTKFKWTAWVFVLVLWGFCGVWAMFDLSNAAVHTSFGSQALLLQSLLLLGVFAVIWLGGLITIAAVRPAPAKEKAS